MRERGTVKTLEATITTSDPCLLQYNPHTCRLTCQEKHIHTQTHRHRHTHTDTIYLSMYLTIYLTIYLSMYLYIYSSIYLNCIRLNDYKFSNLYFEWHLADPFCKSLQKSSMKRSKAVHTCVVGRPCSRSTEEVIKTNIGLFPQQVSLCHKVNERK